MVRQVTLLRDYWLLWLCLAAFATWLLVWNIIRLGVYTLIGKPAITLSSRGMSCAANGYMIKWADITGMELDITTGKGSGSKIRISVKDPWTYIGKIPNPVIRHYRWFINQYLNPSFNIDLSTLDGDKNDNYATIENYYHLHRNAQLGS